MPPLYAQDPLAAVERGAAWRWLDVPVALVDVASEAWMVALIGIALFAWLEREVKDVLEAFAPLALALAASGGVALVVRVAGGVPRPMGAAKVVPLLGQAFPSGQVAAVAAFSIYAVLVYGRRARAALLFATAVAVARAASGPHWAIHLAGSGGAGAVLGAAAYAGALRLFPGGHLARLREDRRSTGGVAAAPPSA